MQNTKVYSRSFPSLSGLQANISYTLSLDYVRQKSRAFFDADMKVRMENHVDKVTLKGECFDITFFVQASL